MARISKTATDMHGDGVEDWSDFQLPRTQDDIRRLQGLPHVDECFYCKMCVPTTAMNLDTSQHRRRQQQHRRRGLLSEEELASEAYREMMASGSVLLGSYFAHEPGGSPSWLFRVRTDRTQSGWAVVKVWCIPVLKAKQRGLGMCDPKKVYAQVKLLLAQQKLTAECGMNAIVPKVWVEPLNGVMPGSGFHVKWLGLWADIADGVSVQNLQEAGKPPLQPEVLIHLLAKKINHQELVQGAIFDLLFSQCDRHQQNIFLTETGKFWLIDNDQRYGYPVIRMADAPTNQAMHRYKLAPACCDMTYNRSINNYICTTPGWRQMTEIPYGNAWHGGKWHGSPGLDTGSYVGGTTFLPEWTDPFCVPWTWYSAKRFCWRCPQAVLVSCVVDGVRSRVKPLAGVMHRDKQLGFIAQLNHMNRARPFLGMHLVDVLVSAAEVEERRKKGSGRAQRPFRKQQIRMVVEVDGRLPPQAPHAARPVWYSTQRRLVPSAPLAAGKLCVGWGMLPGPLLVMRVRVGGRWRQGGGQCGGRAIAAKAAARRRGAGGAVTGV
eukprot:XP_001691463.1 predicted protein [Chlamydomonas reinhardtii]